MKEDDIPFADLDEEEKSKRLKKLKSSKRKFHPNTLQSNESLHTPHQNVGPVATGKRAESEAMTGVSELIWMALVVIGAAVTHGNY